MSKQPKNRVVLVVKSPKTKMELQLTGHWTIQIHTEGQTDAVIKKDLITIKPQNSNGNPRN